MNIYFLIIPEITTTEKIMRAFITSYMAQLFLSQLTEMERESYEFARRHLGDTFSLGKSNAYEEWFAQHTTKSAVRIQKWWRHNK